MAVFGGALGDARGTISVDTSPATRGLTAFGRQLTGLDRSSRGFGSGLDRAMSTLGNSASRTAGQLRGVFNGIPRSISTNATLDIGDAERSAGALQGILRGASQTVSADATLDIGPATRATGTLEALFRELGAAGLLIDDGFNTAANGMVGTAQRTAGGIRGSLGTALGTGLGFIGAQVVGKAVGGFSQAVSGALDYSGALANVNSIAQLTGPELASLNRDVIAMANDPRVLDGPTQLANGLYDIYSSGFQGAEGLQVLEAASIAATAGITTTETSGRAIAGVLNAYGQDASQAAHVSDVLFQTVNSGVITFDELANNMASTTPLAASLGVTIEELGAAYASLTLQNIPASQAETGIANVMRAAINPTDALTTAVQAHGYASAEAMIETEGLGGFLAFVTEQSGGTAEGLMDLLGTSDAVTAALALGNTEGAGYVDMLDDMEGASDGVGATQAALAKQMESARFKVDKAKQALATMATVILGLFMPAVGAAADLVTKFALAVQNSVDSVSSLLGKIPGVSDFFDDVNDSYDDLRGNVEEPIDDHFSELTGDNPSVENIREDGDELEARLRRDAQALYKNTDDQEAWVQRQLELQEQSSDQSRAYWENQADILQKTGAERERWIQSHLDTYKVVGPVEGAFRSFGQTLVDLDGPMGFLLGGLGHLSVGIADLIPGFKGLRAKGIGPVRAGIQALGLVFPRLTGLTSRLDRVVHSVGNTWGDLTSKFQFFRALGADPVVSALDALGMTFPSLMGFTTDLVGRWNTLTQSFRGFTVLGYGPVSSALGALGNAFPALQRVTDPLRAGITELTAAFDEDGLAGALRVVPGLIGDAIVGMVGLTVDFVGWALTVGVPATIGFVGDILGDVKGEIEGFLGIGQAAALERANQGGSAVEVTWKGWALNVVTGSIRWGENVLGRINSWLKQTLGVTGNGISGTGITPGQGAGGNDIGWGAWSLRVLTGSIRFGENVVGKIRGWLESHLGIGDRVSSTGIMPGQGASGGPLTWSGWALRIGEASISWVGNVFGQIQDWIAGRLGIGGAGGNGISANGITPGQGASGNGPLTWKGWALSIGAPSISTVWGGITAVYDWIKRAFGFGGASSGNGVSATGINVGSMRAGSAIPFTNWRLSVNAPAGIEWASDTFSDIVDSIYEGLNDVDWASIEQGAFDLGAVLEDMLFPQGDSTSKSLTPSMSDKIGEIIGTVLEEGFKIAGSFVAGFAFGDWFTGLDDMIATVKAKMADLLEAFLGPVRAIADTVGEDLFDDFFGEGAYTAIHDGQDVIDMLNGVSESSIALQHAVRNSPFKQMVADAAAARKAASDAAAAQVDEPDSTTTDPHIHSGNLPQPGVPFYDDFSREAIEQRRERAREAARQAGLDRATDTYDPARPGGDPYHPPKPIGPPVRNPATEITEQPDWISPDPGVALGLKTILDKYDKAVKDGLVPVYGAAQDGVERVAKVIADTGNLAVPPIKTTAFKSAVGTLPTLTSSAARLVGATMMPPVQAPKTSAFETALTGLKGKLTNLKQSADLAGKAAAAALSGGNAQPTIAKDAGPVAPGPTLAKPDLSGATSAATTAQTLIASLVAKMQQETATAGTKVASVFTGLPTVSLPPIKSLQTGASTAFTGLRTVGDTAFSGLNLAGVGQMNALQLGAVGAAGVTQAGVGGSLTGMQGVGSAAVSGMQGSIIGSMGVMKGGSIGAANATQGGVVGALNTMVGGATGAATGAVRGVVSTLQGGAGAAYGAGLYTGRMAGQGVADGLNQTLGAVQAAASAIASAAAGAMNKSLIIRSPSKKTTQTGVYAGMGLGVGLGKAAAFVVKAATSLAQQVSNALKPQDMSNSMAPYVGAFGAGGGGTIGGGGGAGGGGYASGGGGGVGGGSWGSAAQAMTGAAKAMTETSAWFPTKPEDWVAVTGPNGVIGYAFKQYLKQVGDQWEVIGTGIGLNIRDAASMSGKILTAVRDGTMLGWRGAKAGIAEAVKGVVTRVQSGVGLTADLLKRLGTSIRGAQGQSTPRALAALAGMLDQLSEQDLTDKGVVGLLGNILTALHSFDSDQTAGAVHDAAAALERAIKAGAVATGTAAGSAAGEAAGTAAGEANGEWAAVLGPDGELVYAFRKYLKETTDANGKKGYLVTGTGIGLNLRADASLSGQIVRAVGDGVFLALRDGATGSGSGSGTDGEVNDPAYKDWQTWQAALTAEGDRLTRLLQTQYGLQAVMNRRLGDPIDRIVQRLGQIAYATGTTLSDKFALIGERIAREIRNLPPVAGPGASTPAGGQQSGGSGGASGGATSGGSYTAAQRQANRAAAQAAAEAAADYQRVQGAIRSPLTVGGQRAPRVQAATSSQVITTTTVHGPTYVTIDTRSADAMQRIERLLDDGGSAAVRVGGSRSARPPRNGR